MFVFQFYVVGTPGQKGHQVSLMINGYLTDLKNSKTYSSSFCRIAVTGNLFMDMQDASRVCCLDSFDRNYREINNDKTQTISSHRRSRQYVLDCSDWIVPAYGVPFKVGFCN